MARGHAARLGTALGGLTGLEVLLIAALLVGCSRPLVLAESARQLSADARSVLAEGARRLSPPGTTPVTVTDLTQACGDGLRKKVFRGRLPLRRSASTSVMLDQAAAVTLELIRERGYRLERPPAPGQRTFTMARDAPEVRLTVRLGGGRKPVFVLDGTTPCLPE
jgi:hypothetical protein